MGLGRGAGSFGASGARDVRPWHPGTLAGGETPQRLPSFSTLLEITDRAATATWRRRQPRLARTPAISYRAIDAAIPAFSDSLPDAIGMDTSMSQAAATTRESPRPSEPTTRTIGPSAIDMSRTLVVPAASSPATKKPAFLYPSIARVRLTACATGSRTSAPADAFHAPAVTPADLRAGTTTPGAPNAAADRTPAPRLRGSVTPSSATMSGKVAPVLTARSSGCAYS